MDISTNHDGQDPIGNYGVDDGGNSSTYSGGNGSTNLIINYLPQSMTDKEFYHLFSLVGPVASARVIRDKQTGYSFGYGFVEYEIAEDAARAIDQLNKHPIQHKIIKVAYSKPPGTENKNINLYVAGLPPQVTQESLQSFFSAAGEIVQCNVVRDKNSGKCQGIGFVLYASRAEADTAIQTFNGQPFMGSTDKNMIVRFAKTDNRNSHHHQAFARNFHLQMTAQNNMIQYPSMWYNTPGFGGGPIRGPKAARGRFSPMSTFGYKANTGFTPNVNGNIVFVYGIGPDTSEDMLRELFSTCGIVTNANVINGKGYGFVHYQTSSEANQAVHCMNNMTYQGKLLQVSIKT